MAKCPSCGADNQSLVKSWSMIGKPSKSGEMFKLTMGLYECRSCGKSFRCVEDKEKITMKGVLDRNNLLEEKLMEATKKRSELEERVQALENEKVCLVTEIEALKIIPALEEKASSLESDLKRLRAEKDSLLRTVNAIMAEKTPAPKEKPLEAYIFTPVSEDQSPVVETSFSDDAVVDIESKTTAEAVIPGVPCEATQTDAPVVEISACGCNKAESISSPVEAVEALPIEAAIIENSSVEVLLQETDLPSTSEPAPVEPVVGSSADVSVVEEVSVQIPEAVAFTEAAVVETTSALTKPEEVLVSEAGAVEEKAVDKLQVVADIAADSIIEVALPEVKLEEAIVVEHTPSEALALEAPTTSPMAEVAAGVVVPVEALVEVASNVTPRASEKVEEQVTETPVADDESAILPTAEKVVPVTNDLPEDKSNNVPEASVPAPVQEQVVSPPVIDVMPVVAASEVLVSKQVNVEVVPDVKFDKQPIIEEKLG